MIKPTIHRPLRVIKWLTLAFSMVLAACAAAKDIDQDDAMRLKQAGEILPLEQILATARQHHDGKVIGVELEREAHDMIYEIKILDQNGELWEIKVNANNGKVLQEEEDH